MTAIENDSMYCYIDINNHIHIHYSILKKCLRSSTYSMITEKITDVFNKLLEIEDTVIVHMDLKTLTMGEIEKHSNYITFIISLFKNKYPDRLNTCFLTNCPSIFQIVYQLISKCIDKKTRDKIIFHK